MPDFHRFLAPAVLAAAGLTASCASAPSQPRVIPFPQIVSEAPRTGGLITSYSEALSAVLSVMQNDLGFPPLAGSLRLYYDRASMEAGLISEGYAADYARQIQGPISTSDVQQTFYRHGNLDVYHLIISNPAMIDHRLMIMRENRIPVQVDYLMPRVAYQSFVKTIEASIGSFRAL